MRTFIVLCLVCIFQSQFCFCQILNQSYSLSSPVSSNLPNAAKMYISKTNLFKSIAPIHDRYIPPDYPGFTLVNCSIWPIDLRNFDNLQQIIELKVWLLLEWTDWRLRWTPDNDTFPSSYFLAQRNEIWMPPVDVWSRIAEDGGGGEGDDGSQTHMYYGAHVTVHANGSVRSSAYFIDKTRCPMRLRHFPFDQQTCYFYLVGNHNTSLQPKPRFANVSQAIYETNQDRGAFESGEWLLYANDEIVNRTLANATIMNSYADTGELYLQYTFYLTRKPEQHIFSWIVSPILLSMSSVVSMYLGCDSTERYNFGSAVMITLTLMLSSLRGSLAVGMDGFPILGDMYAGLMATMIVATLLSSLPQYLYGLAAQAVHFQRTVSPIITDGASSETQRDNRATWSSSKVLKKNKCRFSLKFFELLCMSFVLVLQSGVVVFALISWWPALTRK